MEHNHDLSKKSNEHTLLVVLILTTIVLIAEVVGGIITQSLALISDAAHMLTDVTALVIALAAIRIGRRPADTVRTFGYYRFEVLAAAFNAILLFLVAIYIVYEAYQRLQHPPEIHSMGMLIIASIGLIVNIFSIHLLNANKDENLNMKGVFLEVWSDMLGSIGVIIGALLIRFTGWTWIDSLIAVLIGLWILPRTWVLLKESINVLLEGVPKGIDLKALETSICSIEGILNIHELHVWAIASGKISLTAHLVMDEKYNAEVVLLKVREYLASQFGILHTTLQQESKKCMDEQVHCNFSSN